MGKFGPSFVLSCVATIWLLVVYTAALVFAISRRTTLRRAGAPAIVGFSVLIFVTMVRVLILYWQSVLQVDHRLSGLPAFLTVWLSYLSTLLGMIGVLLITLALFWGRSDVNAPPNLRSSGP